MKFVVGIPSFNRPKPLELALTRLAHLEGIDSVIIVADATDPVLLDKYKEVVKNVTNCLSDIIYDIKLDRRGSVYARNRIFELVDQHFTNNYVLITYDDDYICPLGDWLSPIHKWLNNEAVGVVGGRVINLRHRRIDPDFTLNFLPHVADVLTKVTGFILLDTKHGPRYVEYTTPLMAIKKRLIKKGLRYDPKYRGTGYREESDLQEQVRRLGYRIIFEPRFYVYHLNLEEGGNRSMQDIAARFYWKARNHTYFMLKHQKPIHKLILSNLIIITYALLYGNKTFTSAMRGLKEAFHSGIASREG